MEMNLSCRFVNIFSNSCPRSAAPDISIRLRDLCATTHEQRKMRKEFMAGDYNLSAWHVDADRPSNRKIEESLSDTPV
jgi:hypothetical protein